MRQTGIFRHKCPPNAFIILNSTEHERSIAISKLNDEKQNIVLALKLADVILACPPGVKMKISTKGGKI